MDCSSRDWVDMLGRCTEVQEASIGGDSAISFCRALSMTTAGRSVAEVENCTQRDLFLGGLGFLRLSNIDFGTWQHEDSQAAHRLFAQWLAERQQVEAAPKVCIELQTCSITARCVASLQDLATVIWDDYEGYSEQDNDSDEGSDT